MLKSNTVPKEHQVLTTVTLLRHGQSVWNHEKRLTGWTDVGLSEQGIAEAKRAGQLLKDKGYTFDLCFTSCLTRAIDTVRIVLETMNLEEIPVQKSWRLNERHYGKLQGLSWREAAKKYGPKQVLIWQRHFDVRPPVLDSGDPRFPGHDPIYSELTKADLPHTESLKDTLTRTLPYWQDRIMPEVRKGKRILIVAHHNSLRGLVKYLDNIADADIPKMTIRTADPLVYSLNAWANLLAICI